MKRRELDSGSSLFLSIAIHAIVIGALATITFHYRLGLGVHETAASPEQLRYVALARSRERPGNGADQSATPSRAAPAPLRAPAAVPTSIAPPLPASPTAGAVSGKVGGKGSAPAGIATGVEPLVPDPRIALEPGRLAPVPKTPAERVDSAVKSIFQTYADSVSVADAHQGRAPGDWTIDRDGQKWGWDPKGIHLGKFSIPNAILAAIPMRVGANGNALLDQRSRANIRQDILDHSRGMSEDDFRAAVRRIRERKERERKEQKERDKTVAGPIANP